MINDSLMRLMKSRFARLRKSYGGRLKGVECLSRNLWVPPVHDPDGRQFQTVNGESGMMVKPRRDRSNILFSSRSVLYLTLRLIRLFLSQFSNLLIIFRYSTLIMSSYRSDSILFIIIQDSIDFIIIFQYPTSGRALGIWAYAGWNAWQ